MEKKGFQLSANMLVVIILGIVLFSLGMLIFGNIVDTSKDFEAKVNERTEQELFAAMNDGSLVFVPEKIKNGNRGEMTTFTYSFFNEGNTPADFTVIVNPVDSDAEAVTEEIQPNEGNPLKGNFSFPSVPANEKRAGMFGIKIDKDADSGQYSYDFKVLKNGNEYGSVRRVNIVIK